MNSEMLFKSGESNLLISFVCGGGISRPARFFPKAKLKNFSGTVALNFGEVLQSPPD